MMYIAAHAVSALVRPCYRSVGDERHAAQLNEGLCAWGRWLVVVAHGDLRWLFGWLVGWLVGWVGFIAGRHTTVQRPAVGLSAASSCGR